MLRKLISPHYLGFYACIFAGMFYVNKDEALIVSIIILISNLIGVHQGWNDAHE